MTNILDRLRRDWDAEEACSIANRLEGLIAELKRCPTNETMAQINSLWGRANRVLLCPLKSPAT